MAKITEQQAYEIGVEGYVYFYPLILMDVTRRVMTNVPPGVKGGFGPANTFAHMRAFPDANFREVVRPNFDTLYSIAWIDMTMEPQIISVPDTDGRYYLLPMIDMWTDVFAVPGKRTSGTGAGHFAIVPPGWNGTLPDGVQRIAAPTAYAWIIGRTQTNGKADYAAVAQVQDGYKVTALSQWGKAPQSAPFKADPTVDMKIDPMTQVNTMPATTYFAYAAELMKVHAPHITDWSILARLARIGIVPGQSFDLGRAESEVKTALERAVTDGLKLMQTKAQSMAPVVNGWQILTDTIGVYGNYYLKRAIVALIGLGANQPEDAIYPLCVHDAEGKRLDGKFNYVMHFGRDELPPVNAFWSVTMYDAEGFPSANELDRFAIGDRDALKYNADGSLDLYLQHASPGAEKVSNWLPAPKCLLGVTMRLYAPKAQVSDGRWNPPAIKKVE